MASTPEWTILFIGGGVGTGKSTLSLSLAQHFGVRAIEGDLFRLLLLSTISKDDQPDLHMFSESDIWSQPVADIVERAIRVDQYLCRAAELVVAREAARGNSSIIEAVWLSPGFARQSTFAGRSLAGRVKSLFLYEPNMMQLRNRFVTRNEWWHGVAAEERTRRLAFFHAFGLEVKRRAEALRLPVLESRPFETLVNRALDAIGRPCES